MSIVIHRGKLNTAGINTSLKLIPLASGKAGFSIYCARCHQGLCREIEVATWTESDRGVDPDSPQLPHNIIFVYPCPRCSENREDAIPYPGWVVEARR